MNLATNNQLQSHVLNTLRTNEHGVRVTFTKKDGIKTTSAMTIITPVKTPKLLIILVIIILP